MTTRITMHLDATDEKDLVRLLTALLKRLGSDYGVRCVRVFEQPPGLTNE